MLRQIAKWTAVCLAIGAAMVVVLYWQMENSENAMDFVPPPPRYEPKDYPPPPFERGSCDSTEPFKDPGSNLLPTEGLVLRLSASEGVELLAEDEGEGSDRVEVWKDLSGHGHDMGLEYPTMAPTLRKHAYNCVPAVAFDGKRRMVRLGVLGLKPTEGRTFVVVARVGYAEHRSQMLAQGIFNNKFIHLAVETNTWRGTAGRFAFYMVRNPTETPAKVHRNVALHMLSLNTMDPEFDQFGEGGVRFWTSGELQPLRQIEGTGKIHKNFMEANYTAVGDTVSREYIFFIGEIFDVLVYRGGVSDEKRLKIEEALMKKFEPVQ